MWGYFMDLVVKNAKIALESGVFVGDIGIKDGKIASLSQYGTLTGKEEIDEPSINEIIEKAIYFLFCIHNCQKSIIFANERCEYLGVVENSIV